jgi:hypothetical protein
MKKQFISRLPIPDVPSVAREAIGAIAMEITELSRTRYHLHRRARHRIHSDLSTSEKGLNQKLTAWWDLDFPVFRNEVKKQFTDLCVKV